MHSSLLPAFQIFPEEASIIGRLLAGYGELEYAFALCLGRVLGKEEPSLRAIFRLWGEASKLDVGDALMRPSFAEIGLSGEYSEAFGAVRYCRSTRNRYAHCHWAGDHAHGLFFTNLQDAAEGTGSFTPNWRRVDIAQLEAEDRYFAYTAACLWHLNYEFAVGTGKLNSHTFPKPTKQQQPKLCNLPKRDTLPWTA
jgi:hypothetical protein